MDSEMPYFLIWSLCIKRLVHHEVYCIFWSCLLSFLCISYVHTYVYIYIPFLLYEFFIYLSTIIFFTAFSNVIDIKMSVEAE